MSVWTTTEAAVKILQSVIKIAAPSLPLFPVGPGNACLLSFEAHSHFPDPEQRKKGGETEDMPGEEEGQVRASRIPP